MKGKSKMFLVLLTFICSGIFFSQCKKYEEDDVFIQWKTVKKRIDNGKPWKFGQLLIDDVDFSVEFRNDSAYFEEIYFTIFSHGNATTETPFRVKRFGTFAEFGDFSLIEKKRKINISAVAGGNFAYLDNETNYGPIFIDQTVSWNIKKLTKSEFILETKYLEKMYKLKLIR